MCRGRCVPTTVKVFGIRIADQCLWFHYLVIPLHATISVLGALDVLIRVAADPRIITNMYYRLPGVTKSRKV